MYVQGFKDNGVTVPWNYVYTVPLLKKGFVDSNFTKSIIFIYWKSFRDYYDSLSDQ